MSKIVNPYSYRLGIIRDWRSRWMTGGQVFGKEYTSKLTADVLLREFLTKKLRGKMIGDIEMERSKGSWKVKIHTARPGLIIGREGEGMTDLKKMVDKFLKQKKIVSKDDLRLDIVEISNPETNAKVVAMMVAEGLEKRLPFRRVMKTTIEKVIANKDVLGVKVTLGGRLGGADMARVESLKKGNIPLQTLRADIDFMREKAHMTYGVIGIKVWIYKGNVFAKKQNAKPQQ
jgi:small subunit ribosomal protein S3